MSLREPVKTLACLLVVIGDYGSAGVTKITQSGKKLF